MYETALLEKSQTVDSFRFLDGVTKKLVQNWIKLEAQRPVPWTPLDKPLAQSRVALISSAGLALKTDQPFDQEGERQNPWWGDPSFRTLPVTATAADVALYHLHIHPRVIARDLNTLFPLERLRALEAQGAIGGAADRHYSTMGYILQPEALLQESMPAMIRHLEEDEVDLVLLVPG